LGGGGSLDVSSAPQASRVALYASYPSSATQWTVVGMVITSLNGGTSATATAYAICG
jgi:hypothetical protein